jgi:hypothetical protein
MPMASKLDAGEPARTRCAGSLAKRRGDRWRLTAIGLVTIAFVWSCATDRDATPTSAVLASDEEDSTVVPIEDPPPDTTSETVYDGEATWEFTGAHAGLDFPGADRVVEFHLTQVAANGYLSTWATFPQPVTVLGAEPVVDIDAVELRPGIGFKIFKRNAGPYTLPDSATLTSTAILMDPSNPYAPMYGSLTSAAPAPSSVLAALPRSTSGRLVTERSAAVELERLRARAGRETVVGPTQLQFSITRGAVRHEYRFDTGIGTVTRVRIFDGAAERERIERTFERVAGGHALVSRTTTRFGPDGRAQNHFRETYTRSRAGGQQ